MMKPTKIKPLSPIMERHTPQHPLPEEIKKLTQDETVCQFCGVSYLIHHEIKRLEDHVAKLEEELEEYQGALERETQLRADLERNKSAIDQLSHLINDKDVTIETITREIEEVKMLHEKSLSDLTSERKQRIQALNKFKSYKDKIKPCLTGFQSEIIRMKSDLSQVKLSIEEANQQTSLSVAEINARLPMFAALSAQDRSLMNEKNVELAVKLEAAYMEITEWKTQTSHYKDEITSLKLDFETANASSGDKEKQMHERTIELESMCKELNSKLKLSETQCKSIQAQYGMIEDKLKKKQAEQQNATFKLQKTEENANKTIQRLNEDCRQLERELSASQEDVRKMRAAQKERERKEQELYQQASLSSGQIEEIKVALAEVKSTNKALIEERALMITSHQNQIQQLRENFKKKLEGCEDFPSKTKRELELAEERHTQAMSELEKSLRDDFNITLSVEKDKHAEAMMSAKNKHKKEIRELDADFQKELTPYRNQVATLTQKIELLTSNMQEKQKEFQEENESLKKIVTALELRITELSSEQEDQAALKKLQLVADGDKMKEIVKENEQLEQTVISMKEEISLLQDTVRRECEERFELTEALSQARSDLKTCKLPNSSSQGSLNPVSALNKLNPNGIDAEQNNKLSGRTLRSLETDSVLPKSANHIPSLRSLPDLQPRRDSNNFNNNNRTTPSPPYESSTVSTSIKDLSFGAVESPTRRSQSNGSFNNGHSPSGRTSFYNGAGTKSLTHSKSADSVDNVRKRIAAAIKRK